MVQMASESLATDEAAALWGKDCPAATTAYFETPGTAFGVRVVRFEPASALVIRDREQGFDCDALKVIDFYAPDFDAGRAHLRKHGWELKDDVATYETEAGTITEGHLWGPDNVVCALISGPSDFLADFVTISDRCFSEILSVSGPVTNPDAVVEFYRSIALDVVYRYGLKDDSFDRLVGATASMQLSAVNLGSSRAEPYFGVIHYGLPDGSFRSLSDRARFPHRGLVAATVEVPVLDTALQSLLQAGGQPVTERTVINLAPWGSIESIVVCAPHGVLHQLIERRNRSHVQAKNDRNRLLKPIAEQEQ